MLALVAAGCSSSPSSSSSGTTPVNGGTAVWAEPPSSTPSYIFPYVDSTNISNLNLFDLQYLMYRPLYWFGQNGQPEPNNSLSLANPPVVSGQTATITLKHYMWSNGTQVTAQNVMFWLNMEKAEPADYGAYTGFPANTTSIKVVSPTELQITFSKAYSPSWILYNDLSQVVPMPTAWDRTASGPSHCETTVSDCAAVYSYLNKQAENLSGYATSPIWGVVDGPWRLSSFNADGHNTFVPNKKYSGPVKPKLSAFEEVPFTTDAAEYDVLRSPSSSTKISVGYLPDEDAPAKPANAATGSNPLSGYTLDPLYPWGIDYSAINFQSSIGDHGAIFKQLYFRQALQYEMNQAAIISGPLRGYGALTVGPVAATPATKWLSSKGRDGDPYPYNPTKAKQLLASNGWKVTPGGISTCVKPGTGAGECGAGITAGSALNFTFLYLTGTAWVQSEMTQLQSNASSIGIKLNLVPKTLGDVLSEVGGNCVVVKSPCNWDMANWGFGWSFSPDYLPTGDQLFECGAVANSGGYCDKTNDSLIQQTLTNDSLSLFYKWQNYLAPQLPVIYQPNAAYTLTEVANNLKGYFPQSPTLSLTPENWYFVK
ncbi:MAG TPA: ABC transporter substrate-binding protein [Streptosporangiaceae bacterium]|nr:ABC transporter substrate-binding protein [Streptosporangiaceae bacterium]